MRTCAPNNNKRERIDHNVARMLLMGNGRAATHGQAGNTTNVDSFKQYTGEQMCKYFSLMSIVLASDATRSISTSYPPKLPWVTVGRGNSAETRPISACW